MDTSDTLQAELTELWNETVQLKRLISRLIGYHIRHGDRQTRQALVELGRRYREARLALVRFQAGLEIRLARTQAGDIALN